MGCSHRVSGQTLCVVARRATMRFMMFQNFDNKLVTYFKQKGLFTEKSFVRIDLVVNLVNVCHHGNSTSWIHPLDLKLAAPVDERRICLFSIAII